VSYARKVTAGRMGQNKFNSRLWLNSSDVSALHDASAIKLPLYFITRESVRNSNSLFHFLMSTANRLQTTQPLLQIFLGILQSLGIRGTFVMVEN